MSGQKQTFPHSSDRIFNSRWYISNFQFSIFNFQFFFSFLILFLSILFLFSCSGPQKEERPGTPARITYASGFTIDYTDTYTLVTVLNPWDTARVLHRYVLVDRNQPIPEKLPEGDVVKIPVERIACLSSVDASMIEILGDLQKVKAMSEVQYVKMPVLKKGLESGAIADIGNHASLNMERLMEVIPDIIIVSPYQNMGYGKLETSGVAIVECAAYMENTPLGRAEWIRFIGAFLKKDTEAELYMNRIAGTYLSLKEKTGQVTHRPTVFSEKKYGPVWYVPGGKSYMAHFFEDAGADYLWKDDDHNGSLALNFETVYHQAENADFWLIKSDEPLTYARLRSEYDSYSWFNAWKDRKIIFSNTAENNYYEEGVMNPDLVLGDLIRFFHPEIELPERTSSYFEWMKE